MTLSGINTSYIDLILILAYNIDVDGRNLGKEKGSSPKLPFSHLETTNVI